MRYLLIFLLSILLISCSQKKGGQKIKEGVIEYEIEYLSEINDPTLAALLPDLMIYKFDKNTSVNLMRSKIGLASIIYKADCKANQNSTVFLIRRNKYLYEESGLKPSLGMRELKNFKLEPVDQTKTVLGYECNKIILHFGDKRKQVEMFYTPKITTNVANMNNFFNEIDGTLLEFCVKMNDIEMYFKAKEIQKAKLDDNDFKLPEKCEKVPKEIMENILNTNFM